MAVKLLLGPAAGLASAAAAAEQLLSPTNPLIAALEQVRAQGSPMPQHCACSQAVMELACWTSAVCASHDCSARAGRRSLDSQVPCGTQPPTLGLLSRPLDIRTRMVGFPALHTSLLCCDMALQEAGVMASLRHPNVLSFLAVCKTPPCLVSEFCPRGSLYETLAEARASPVALRQLTWLRRLKMVSLCAGWVWCRTTWY